MAGQEGSIAPKERVNIVYRPATGDAKEEVELPLKVLVMAFRKPTIWVPPSGVLMLLTNP